MENRIIGKKKINLSRPTGDFMQVWDTTSKSVLMKSCIEVKKGSSGPVPCTLSMDGTIAVAGIQGKLKVCKK